MKTYSPQPKRLYHSVFQGLIVALISLLGASQSGLAKAKDFTQCPDLLREAATVSSDPVTRQLEMTDENLAYLKFQRENLRAVVNKLGRSFFEMDHVTRRLLLARMTGKHVFLFGEPGGAKSALSRVILGLKSLKMTDGEAEKKVRAIGETFYLQMNQMTSDVALKGFTDYDQDLEGLSIEEIHRKIVKDQGTLIKYTTALIDEVDKANPVALAALLDVLNEGIAQHGPITLEAKTKTVVFTSNMTLYEFIDTFHASGMESTARALLDRIPFITYVANTITDPKKRRQFAMDSARRKQQARLARRANPNLAHHSELDLFVEETLDEFTVDFEFLSDLAGSVGIASPLIDESEALSTVGILDNLYEELKSAFYARRRATEAAAAANPLESGPIYYPPTIFSTRTIPLILETVSFSLLLDLLLLPEEDLPTEVLAQLISQGLPIHPESTWRAQDIYLTAAPGDPRLEYSTDDQGQTQIQLTYGPELERLAENEQFDKRAEVLMGFIAAERDDFAGIWNALIAQHLQSSQNVSELLAELLGADSSKDSSGINLEWFIDHVRKKNASE